MDYFSRSTPCLKFIPRLLIQDCHGFFFYSRTSCTLPTQYLDYLGYLLKNPSRLPTYLLHTYPPTSYLLSYPSCYSHCKVYKLYKCTFFQVDKCEFSSFQTDTWQVHVHIGMFSSAHYTLPSFEVQIDMFSNAHCTLPHACCQVFMCTLHITIFY